MKRSLIVGNTDGIGLALTRRLLAAGHIVTGVSRRGSPLVAHQSYEHIIANVAARDYPETLHEVVGRRGPFDLCVYCAAIGDRLDLEDLPRESEVFRVNVIGAVDTLAAIVPGMLAARDGHFIALSSLADEMVSCDVPSYAASKAGLSSYLAGVALALRPRGLAVSNVRFGFVDTKMAKSHRRPFMIPVERAVDVIIRCMETRRARVSYPLRMALLMKVLRIAPLLRLRWSSSPRKA